MWDVKWSVHYDTEQVVLTVCTVLYTVLYWPELVINEYMRDCSTITYTAKGGCQLFSPLNLRDSVWKNCYLSSVSFVKICLIPDLIYFLRYAGRQLDDFIYSSFINQQFSSWHLRENPELNPFFSRFDFPDRCWGVLHMPAFLYFLIGKKSLCGNLSGEKIKKNGEN